MKQPARSEGGFRLFSEMEIRDLVFIQKAQELGFSLTEIKQLSVLNQQYDHACSQVRGLITSKLRDVRGSWRRYRLFALFRSRAFSTGQQSSCWDPLLERRSRLHFLSAFLNSPSRRKSWSTFS